MSLSINVHPAGYALVGNPIKLSVATTSLTTFTIKKGSKVLYIGNGEGEFHVFIQDILKHAVSPWEFRQTSEEIIDCGDSATDIIITAENETGDVASTTITAVTGGISKRELRRMNSLNTNIFTLKLLNPDANFFKSTRSGGNIVYLKESELNPLSFIAPSASLILAADAIKKTYNLIIGKAYALNLQEIRKAIYLEHGIIPSVFTIGGATIIIEESPITQNRYIIEFLNSYSAYERIEVTGSGELKYEEKEESIYSSYDDLVDDYVDIRDRKKSRGSFNVSTGLLSSSDLAFILDMISSDDVKLVGDNSRHYKVIPQADNLVAASRSTEPFSLKITLKFDESDEFYSGELADFDNTVNQNRIHTEQFTKEFN